MAKKWKEFNKLSEKTKKRLQLLNELSGSEWTQLSRSVVKYGGPIANKRKIIGAAYPISLAKHMIKLFTIKQDLVLDPFLGVGTTLDAARLLGRNGIGFELNPEFYELAKSGVDDIDRSQDDFQGEVENNIINDSCQNLRNYIDKDSISFTLTSPPYADLLNKTVENFTSSEYSSNIYKSKSIAQAYSSEDQDFGNMSREEYSVNIQSLMKDIFEVSREGSFNVWVVRDFRDMENHNPYVNLHGKIIQLAQSVGWVFTDMIIWDQTSQRRLIKLGGPKSRRFYFNIGHSFLLIFRKNIKGESFWNDY